MDILSVFNFKSVLGLAANIPKREARHAGMTWNAIQRCNRPGVTENEETIRLKKPILLTRQNTASAFRIVSQIK